MPGAKRAGDITPTLSDSMTWRVADHGTTSENDSQTLWWDAGIARSHGWDELADRLERQAREAEWVVEAAKAAAWVPRTKLPAFNLLNDAQREIMRNGERGTVTDLPSRHMPTDLPMSKNVVSLRSGTTDLDTASPRRPCGVRHLLRVGGSRTVRRRFLCGARRCANCRPRVLARKANAVTGERLYARQVERGNEWVALDKRLRRLRTKGEAGEYMRIPLDHDRLLIVSDAEIGPPISRETMSSYIDEAEVAHGSITSSKGWRPDKVPISDDIVDEGEITSSDEWVTKVATRMGLDPAVISDEGDIDFGETTDEQHERIKRAACVRSRVLPTDAHTGGQLAEAWAESRAA